MNKKKGKIESTHKYQVTIPEINFFTTIISIFFQIRVQNQPMKKKKPYFSFSFNWLFITY